MPPAFLLLAMSLFDFRQAAPGYHYQFPRDHFNHPEFRTEWWYYTGNVHSREGHRYGFELVFFRQARQRGEKFDPSNWRVDDLYMAHLAMTDLDAGRFQYTKRLNRAGPGIAGVSLDAGRIWNGNWDAKWGLASDAQTLTAVAEGIRMALRLTPLQPPVIHGENGVSQKAAGAGQASYYVSFPRLAVEGTLNGVAVTGTAWMDHEWFSFEFGAAQQGWDWFSIQLEDQTELMLLRLRHTDGGVDPYSSGTYIGRDGRAVHLRGSEFETIPVEYWTSSRTGARYPVHWRIRVPGKNIALECRTAVPQQELIAEDAAGPTYWEGAVAYSGSVSGVGYLEMTGYTMPMRF